MEKNGNNSVEKKKRGRPSKTNASSSSLETEPRTKKATPSSQEMNGHFLETLSEVKKILFDSGSVDNAIIPTQVVSVDAPTSHESADPSTVIVASPAHKTTMTSPAVSEAVSELSEPEDGGLVKVEGYEVKEKVAPLLRAIFNKYGDIASESIFSMESRPWLLEAVCSIYNKLEASDFTQVNLNSLKAQIKDLEALKMNVGWLRERLDWVSKVVGMDLNGRDALYEAVDEKMAAVKKIEEELDKMKIKLEEEKDVLGVLQLCCGSLVNGLV